MSQGFSYERVCPFFQNGLVERSPDMSLVSPNARRSFYKKSVRRGFDSLYLHFLSRVRPKTQERLKVLASHIFMVWLFHYEQIRRKADIESLISYHFKQGVVSDAWYIRRTCFKTRSYIRFAKRPEVSECCKPKVWAA